MQYKVINHFSDLKDNKWNYTKNDVYPREGYKPSKKRIEELSQVHPKHKVAFIAVVEEPEKEKPSSDK